MCLTFSHRSASSNIRAPRIFIKSPRIFLPLAYARGAVRCAENKNPGGLFSSPGFGISCLTLSSGYPIGEPRRNYRYRDNNNNAYYNDVENKSAVAQLRLAARGREVERAVGTTIGHSIFQSEELGRLKRPGQYRPSSSYRLLNTFYQKINRVYHKCCRTTSPNSVVPTRTGWLFRSGVP